VSTSTITLPRIALWGVALAYAVALQIVYVQAVSPIFAYQGMVTQQLPTSTLVLQIILALLPVAWLPTRLDAPSQFQAQLLYIIVYVPSAVVGFHICAPDAQPTYILYLLACAIGVVFVSQQHRLPPLRLPSAALAEWKFILLLLVVSAFTCTVLLLYYGLPSNLFDFAAIYRSRLDFKDKAAAAPVVLNYLYFWQGIVINPVLIILGILRRRVWLLLLGIALQYLLFCITTLRSLVLSVAFSLFIVSFMKGSWRYKGVLFAAFILVVAVAGGAMMGGDGVGSIASRIFVQRWLTIQGQLSGAYVDFFAVRDKIHLGSSVFSDLVNYDYGQLTPGEVIGDQYVSMGRGPIPNATANFWADAFAQFGLTGVLGATVAAIFLLWLTDSALKDSPRGVAIMLFSTCALSLTEQGVQTGVLTGGLLPLLVIGWLGKKALSRANHAQNESRALDLSP
jgi:oligosaccharide repeat unit polymerase